MKKVLLLFILLTSIVLLTNGQDYTNGIGIRGGFYSGVTFKHFLGKKPAFEGILSTRWGGFELTGLYEIHEKAFDVDGLRWFYGFGAHLGTYNGDHADWGEPATQYFLLGADGILGIEYTFRDIPVNLGLDWKPVLNLTGYPGFWGDGGALSIRYVF
jgi:hypothetical protein